MWFCIKTWAFHYEVTKWLALPRSVNWNRFVVLTSYHTQCDPTQHVRRISLSRRGTQLTYKIVWMTFGPTERKRQSARVSLWIKSALNGHQRKNARECQAKPCSAGGLTQTTRKHLCVVHEHAGKKSSDDARSQAGEILFQMCRPEPTKFQAYYKRYVGKRYGKISPATSRGLNCWLFY